ncbi:response regulator transcription factor [Hydrogenimonas sp. SS33]|uniref:response regulator transcription factor n=1 Tax=Hydrogenimonas leucolamina TaxID=2954236 RepID=UPI00336C232E
MAKRILLLEDDRALGETLRELLEENGYAVDLAAGGGEAADLSYDNDYDLYIFDINVPEIDGFELLEGLRNARDRTPTLFISAMVDVKTIARGFELGAEDYLKKPFYPEELLIRVNARLAKAEGSIECGDISFDPASSTVRKGGSILPLGEVQLCLLKHFLQNIGKVMDRDVLMECLEQPSAAALRVAINKLKEKTGLRLKNVRGLGYALEAC